MPIWNWRQPSWPTLLDIRSAYTRKLPVASGGNVCVASTLNSGIWKVPTGIGQVHGTPNGANSAEQISDQPVQAFS